MIIEIILKHYTLKGIDKVRGDEINTRKRISKYAISMASWGINVADELEKLSLGGIDIFDLSVLVREEIKTNNITYNDLAKICMFIGNFGRPELFRIWKYDALLVINTFLEDIVPFRDVYNYWSKRCSKKDWLEVLKESMRFNIRTSKFIWMGIKDNIQGPPDYNF